MFGVLPPRPAWLRSDEAETVIAAPAPARGLGGSAGREAYLQRLGIRGRGDAERPPVEERGEESGSLPATPLNASTSEGGSEAGTPTTADFRQKFLRKLAYNNVWVPQVHRSPQHQTVIIFDWDDTLLCTSWLQSRNQPPCDGSPSSKGTANSDAIFDAIAQHTKSMLETALKAGHTYIITNAMAGWVEYSAAMWAPELLPTLRKVRVISARDKYQADFPDDVGQWKIQAFLEVQRELDSTPITNLVALGDADFEMEAAIVMRKEFDEGLVKTVKFQPCPDPEEHLKQVELVSKNLERIISSVRNLKVCLERKEAE